MDEKTLCILDLNDDVMLMIMKYIIAGCELKAQNQDDLSKYTDMENFAEAVEISKDLLRIYYKTIYYHRELTELATEKSLKINFAHLQSRIPNKNEGDAIWELFANAIRKNDSVCRAKLSFDPAFPYSEFPKHFQMIKDALQDKERLTSLILALNGYSLDNLNNFDHLHHLTLDVKMSAAALVSVCQSVPQLSELKIMRAEIQGRLSDIVPYCCNLHDLTFVANPNVDVSEYVPLLEIDNLRKMTIHGAFKNGSVLSMFKAMNDWRQGKTLWLTIYFTDVLPPLSRVTMPVMDLMQFLSHVPVHSSDKIELKTSYNFREISRDSRPIEETLATINLCASSFHIDLCCCKNLSLDACSISDIDNLISVLKELNINNLTINIDEYYGEEAETLLPKLFGSMIPDGLFALKSIYIPNYEREPKMLLIDKLTTTRELVKIKSIKLLRCSFVDWECIEPLSELTNLQTLHIEIQSKFEKTYAKELCNLLNTCQGCTFIRCFGWRIELKSNKGINSLSIFDDDNIGSLNELFEALAYRTFTANDEVDISHMYLDFKDIHKVSEIQTLKKLSISIKDINGIEKLSELPELEELKIRNTTNKSLIKLFDQLAAKKSPSLQSLTLWVETLSPDELFLISRISSLRTLKLSYTVFENDALVTVLANSNIEELTFLAPDDAKCPRNFNLMELPEICKLKNLRVLRGLNLDSTTLPYLRKLKHLNILYINLFKIKNLKHNLATLKKLVIHFKIGLKKCVSLSELDNLESLTLSLKDVDGLYALSNMKSLKELVIEDIDSLLTRPLRVLASKRKLNLEYLNVPIQDLDELKEITRMESLKKLHLRIAGFEFELSQSIKLGQLTQLESLYIQIEEGSRLAWWLAIFESCKNLLTCTIECRFDRNDIFIGKVHTILKSIRDPKNQDPLLLTMHINIDLDWDDYHLFEYLDDEYLKVSYSFMT